MTESRRPYGAPQPEPIDDNEDRMGSMEELHFDDEEPSAKIGDTIPEAELEHRLPAERCSRVRTFNCPFLRSRQ